MCGTRSNWTPGTAIEKMKLLYDQTSLSTSPRRSVDRWDDRNWPRSPLEIKSSSSISRYGAAKKYTSARFATLIALAGNVEREPLAKFLDSTVTPDWLANNYAGANLGGLAGALFTLASHLPPEFPQNFDTPDLAARLNREAAATPLEYAVGWADLLSLLGSAAVLVGMPCPPGSIIWPAEIAAVVVHRPARDAKNRLSYSAAQFWCCLHDLARSRGDLIAVPSAEGQTIVEAWREAEPPTLFFTALNAAMIAWLEQCQENNWTLTRPKRPIRQEILARLGNA